MQLFLNGLATVFIAILNMSITASVIIVFVFLTRLCLKRVPRGFSYALWAVVLFRLLCPVSFELPLSAVGMLGVSSAEEYTVSTMQYVSPNAVLQNENGLSDALQEDLLENQMADIVTTEDENESAPAENSSSVQDATTADITDETQISPITFFQKVSSNAIERWGSTILKAIGFIWFIGVLALLVVNFYSLWNLKKQLKSAVLCQLWVEESNICYTAQIPTAFVLGLVYPRVYLPAHLSPHEQKHILLHEQTHIARHDHHWQALAFFALCLHWFNPLVWLAHKASQADMELSCDERVLHQLGNDIKREYAQSLLNLSRGHDRAFHTVLAFGESEAKTRIKNVLAYRKPLRFVTGLVGATLIVASVLLLANPMSVEMQAEQESADIATQENELIAQALTAQTFDAPASEAEILAKRELAFVGLTDEEAQGFILRVQAMNQWLENEWVYGNHFEDFSYPNSLAWNYLTESDEMEYGWLYNLNDWPLQEELGLDNASFYSRYGGYNILEVEYDWNAWLASFETYQTLFTDEAMQADVARLIEYITLAQETHRVEFLREVYYIAHDMDYFLFRYAVPDYAPYVADLSTQETYYGSLAVWEEEYGLRTQITTENLPELTLPASETQSLYEVEASVLEELLLQQWSYRKPYQSMDDTIASAIAYTDLFLARWILDGTSQRFCR